MSCPHLTCLTPVSRVPQRWRWRRRRNRLFPLRRGGPLCKSTSKLKLTASHASAPTVAAEVVVAVVALATAVAKKATG